MVPVNEFGDIPRLLEVAVYDILHSLPAVLAVILRAACLLRFYGNFEHLVRGLQIDPHIQAAPQQLILVDILREQIVQQFSQQPLACVLHRFLLQKLKGHEHARMLQGNVVQFPRGFDFPHDDIRLRLVFH